MDDCDAPEFLGQSRDIRALPLERFPSDFFSSSVDLNEYPVELLKMKQCRSFRADLKHKLTIIIRAHGGYGHRGIWKASNALKVNRKTLWTWLNFRNCPKSVYTFGRIDELYVRSIEKLVSEKVSKKR